LCEGLKQKLEKPPNGTFAASGNNVWNKCGNASKKWTMPVRNWSMAMNQFAIIFGEDRVKIA